MKNYEEFKEALKAAMEESFGEGYEVRISDVKKVDDSYEGISVKRLHSNVAHTLNLQKVYSAYKAEGETVCFLKTIQFMKEALLSHASAVELMAKRLKDKEYILGNVILTLVNVEENSSMLKGYPHRLFLDLAVYYRVCLDIREDQEEIATAAVTDDLARSMGLSEEVLFQMALRNTRRIFPIRYATMTMQNELSSSSRIEDLPNGEIMYMITNQSFARGAVYLVDEKALKDTADKFGTGFFIIPSSIHEILVVRPEFVNSVSCLEDLIQLVNSKELEKGERLSNHAYYYDPEKKAVCMANAIAD